MTATIVGPGGSVKVHDDDGHELEINPDGSINVTGGGGGDASEATLQLLLTELQQKLEAGQEVALNAATLAALESVTAAVTGTVSVSNMIPAVETGLAKEVTLQSLLTELQSKIEAGQEVALDAATLAALESVTAAVTGTVAVSNMIPAVETGLAKETTLGGMASDVDRKFDTITPFSDKFSASNAAVIDPGTDRLRIHQTFIQANPNISGSVEYEIKVGTTVLDAGWLEASQQGVFAGLYEGAAGEDLALTLSEAKEVRLNVRYKVFT